MGWIQQFVTALLGCCLIQVSTAISWKRKPQSQSRPLGGNVTFFCEINDRGNRRVIWQDSSYNILFNGMESWAPDRYSLQGEFNLIITNITKEDNTRFICNVKDLGLAAANLTVLLPPEAPSITLNSSASVFVENQVLALTCSSRGGNPDPTIRWMKNGQYVVDNIVNTPASVIGGVSTSTLTVTLGRSDHRANYTCTVHNQVNADKPLSTFRELSVRYSPFITFAPYNPLNVRLEREATLDCIVDSNPPVTSVSWKKNGQTLPGAAPKRIFNPAIKADTANYTCIASNNIGGPKEATIELNVIYPPVINLQPTFVVSEAERVNITCNIDANPSPYQVHWERVGGDSIPIQNGRYLSFESIRQGNAGNYTCKAWSVLKISGEESLSVMEQGFTYIHVEFPPGNAFIKPVGADYNVGANVELKCSASPEGYPAATFEWKKNRIVQTQTMATYRILNAQLSDIGEYECTPVNKVGRGRPSSISLSINEPPRLTESPNNREFFVPLSNENLLEISCIARGRPSPMIMWYKNNDSVPLTTLYPDFYTIKQTNKTVDQHSYQITNILYFRGSGRNQTSSGARTRFRIDDIGNYTCRVNSSAHTETTSGTASVLVQFKPQKLEEEERVAVVMKQTAQLPCITVAHPRPDFTWYRNNVRISEGGRFSTKIEKLDLTAKYQSVLSILDTQENDLGAYRCQVSNTFGNITNDILLSIRSAPEPPRNLQYIGKTWESVSLRWKAGFNGGLPQYFIVQYSVGNSVQEVRVHPETATTFNITKLTPQTSYVFFVYGKNSIGSGDLSDGLAVQTEELIIPTLGASPSFDSQSKILKVKTALPSNYCLKIEVKTTSTGNMWKISYPCLEIVSEHIEMPDTGITAMNLSVCLRYRNEVCGSPTAVEINQPAQNLTERDVYIIGSVCGVVIVTLLTILVCFICKRKRNQAKEYEGETAARRQQPINGNVTTAQKPPVAYDNTDGPVEMKRNGHIPNRGGQMRPNGNIHHDTSYDSQIEKQIFENEMNRRNENNSKSGRPGELQFHGVPRSPTKDKYVDLEEKKDGSLQSGIESGYSTPDPNKPKKRAKLKPKDGSVYYCGFARFEHDPPGHTCGLPCCREEASVHIKAPPSSYSCMPSHEKVLDDNFTFRRKRYGLISGRPTFSNKFFSLQNINSDEVARQRMPIPDFGVLGRRGEYSGSDLVLTDSLENPFVLRSRPGLRQGEFMCRREMCLPESPDFTRRFRLSEDIGESLDFDDDNDDVASIEYYTTAENGLKVDKCGVKVNKQGHDLALKGQTKDLDKRGQTNDTNRIGHTNLGYEPSEIDSETVTSSEHYYDVLDVIGPRQGTPLRSSRLYPDLSQIIEEETESFSDFKKRYINTLAKKKLDVKPTLPPKQTEKFDTFPGRKTPNVPSKNAFKGDNSNHFHLWNQFTPQGSSTNIYEDIEFKHPEKDNKNDVIDDVTKNESTGSFGSFGYEGDKTPIKNNSLGKNQNQKLDKVRKNDSLKDSPITLIL